MTTYTHDVPVEYLDKVRERLARAQARAERLGVPQPSASYGTPRLIPDPLWDGLAETAPSIRASEVTLTAPEHLGLPGYSLLARVDRLPDGSPLVVRTPGTEDIPLPEIADALYCDHCRHRRRRNETFLVSGPTGFRQVGRNCLRDFLGADPEALLWWSRWLREQAEWMGETMGSGERLLPLTHLLTLAARVAAHGGYLSRRKREELEDARYEASGGLAPDTPPPPPTTRDVIEDWDGLMPPLSAKDRKALAELDERYPADDGSQRLLDATVEALASIDPGRSEWHGSLALVASQDAVRPRHLGIAVSAVVLGLQAIEAAQEPSEEPTEAIVSVPLGAVGERLRGLPVEVTFVRHFESQFGTRTLLKVRAEAQQADLLWFASRYIPEDIVGDTVTLTGTVKAHEDDKYTHRPVTVVTRATIEEA